MGPSRQAWLPLSVFCFLGGDPPPGLHSVTIPLLIMSMIWSANSLVMSVILGWPPSFLNWQSLNVQHPRTLDQHRKGRPMAWTYIWNVGKSVWRLPTASRISARWTRPPVRSRYGYIIFLIFGCVGRSTQYASHGCLVPSLAGAVPPDKPLWVPGGCCQSSLVPPLHTVLGLH
jgi:hypothetical protein